MIQKEEKRRKREEETIREEQACKETDCFILLYQSKPCNQGNHSVVNTTDFLMHARVCWVICVAICMCVGVCCNSTWRYGCVGVCRWVLWWHVWLCAHMD